MEKNTNVNPGGPPSEHPLAAAARAALLSMPMRAPAGPCPGDEEFALFLSAQLDAAEKEVFLGHMEACPSCRQQLLRARSALEHEAGQGRNEEETDTPVAEKPQTEQHNVDNSRPDGQTTPASAARETNAGTMRSVVHRQARALQSVGMKAAFACAAAACLLLLLNQGRVGTDARDPLGDLTAELAALPKTRGRSSPWLDASLQTSSDNKTRLVYVGYAYEASLLKNRGNAGVPVPSNAGGALPYYIAGRLIFAVEQFCATEGKISQKRWESLKAYWQVQTLEGPISDLRSAFDKSEPASCLTLRPAVESLFHAP
ncbi:MAG: hypothetical protein LBP38_04445 [Desulfovibrio sp.]|jgi:hypothetical protein|nr:hypothetical protein [Desulfovibrio sp.]